GSIRAGLLAALAWLLAALSPGGAAEAAVTCPSAAVGQTLNITTTGGVTTCTNIGTAQATEGIEIYNGLVADLHPTAWGLRFGVAFRKVTPSGNEQPTASGCVGDCSNLQPGDVFDEDQPGTSNNGVVADWGYGTGIVTLTQCLAWSVSSTHEAGCTISFQFADGTTGAFSVSPHTNVIPSFSLGGNVMLPPTITSVTPSSGLRGANTQITIIGTGFTNVSRVRFAQYLDAASFQVISSTEIRAVTPAQNSPLTRWLEVITDHGTASGEVFTFAPNLVVTTASLPTATRGASFVSAPLTATGATFAQSFNATGLPPGLTLNSVTGVISGIPTQSGSVPVAVTVTENSGANYGGPFTSSPKQITLVVAEPTAVSVTTLSLAAGINLASYSATLTAAGGIGPYTFSANGLPSGLAIAGNTIAGTPTSVGTFIVTLSATDSTPSSGGGPIVSGPTLLALNITAAPQAITFTSIAASTNFNDTYTPAATGGASGNPVRFFIDHITSGSCRFEGAMVRFVSTTPAATCVILAVQDGNENFLRGNAEQRMVLGVVTQSQAITFTSTPPASPLPGATYTVTATGGGSGKPVTFSIDAASSGGACTISGATVSFTGGGNCIVDANQAAADDSTYYPAPQAHQAIVLPQAAQAISFTSTAPASPSPGTTYTITATGGASGNAVTFAIDAASGSGVCTIAGATVSFAAPGTCLVNASQAGNANYLAAAQVQQSVTVAKIAQAITYTSTVPSLTVVGGSYTATAAGGASGNAVTFSIDAASAAGACTIAGSSISFTGAGACVVNANQAGNASYTAAPQVQQTVTVGKASQTIAFTSTPPSPANVGGSYTVTATGGASGNLVTYSVDATSDSGVCTVSGSTVSFAASGRCIVDADQAGNANYGAASRVQQTVTVAKKAHTIAFTKPADIVFATGATVALQATASSGLAVVFASTTASVCTVSGATVTILAAGTCSITVSQAGDGTYAAASAVTQSFNVGRASQTISFTKPADLVFATGATVALKATASSGLAVSFASTTTAVCTVSGSTATIVAPGACTITASQPGNASYNAAPDVTHTFNALGAPGLKLAVTANPASLSAVGQTVTFTYTVTNAGNVLLTGVGVSDTRAGGITCAANSLAAAAVTTCTGTTGSTAADVAARGISSSATASAIFNGAAVSSAAVSISVGINVAAVQAATSAAVQRMLAQRGSTLVSSGPSTARTHGRLGGGSLTGGGTSAGFAAQSGLASGFGPAGDGRGATALSTLAQRIGHGQRGVASRGPGDLRSELGVPGRDDGGAPDRPAAQPFSFTGSADDNYGRFQFAASLSQARAAAVANEKKKLEGADSTAVMALGLGGAAMGALATPAAQTFDVWLEGSSSYFRNETASVTRRGHAAVVSAGVDMLLHPGLLVGVMAQLDWMSDSAGQTGPRSEGRGW
ncbi:MAG: IPT/TIG domain-containing protein, partial [Hyphomicrobium sp.]